MPPLGWYYDIREIDEDLYLAVLACRKGQFSDAAANLSDKPDPAQVTAGDTTGQ